MKVHVQLQCVITNPETGEVVHSENREFRVEPWDEGSITVSKTEVLNFLKTDIRESFLASVVDFESRVDSDIRKL